MRLLRWCFPALLALLVVMPLQGQTWRQAVEADYPGLSINDVFTLDQNHTWCVGSKGMVLYTTDGGASGQDAVADSTLTLNSVFFLDATTGWAGGSKRSLCKTTNGGVTWTTTAITAIPDTDGVIRSVYFADAQRGWILSSRSSANGRILHTTNGGTAWILDTTVAAKNLNDMSFAKANVGVAVGKDVSTLLYTTDGVKWNAAPAPTLSGASYTRSDVRSVFMMDSVTAYAVGWGSTVGAQPSIHLKTTNGGATWTQQLPGSSNRTYDNLWGVWFKDAATGFASGAGSIFTRTTDGGATWTPATFPCGATVNAVSGAGNSIWLVGADGIIFNSPDFGNMWDMKTSIPSATIYGIQWTSTLVGYAAGFDAVFLKTTDGGNEWNGSFINANRVSQNVNDFHFVSDNVGFAAHSYRMVTKTTDGGATWTAVFPDTTAATVSSLGVYFVDANLGFVVGQYSSSNGVVHKTTNGGATWTTTQNAATKTLRGIGFANANTGAVVGATRTALYTTNGGTSWTPASFTGVPANRASIYLRDVKYLSATVAIAVGDSTILKSTDGGATWNYVATTSKTTLYGVDAAGATTAFAAGSGEVWMTTNAGDTWTNIINPAVVTGTLYCVGVDKGGKPWVGAGSSAIFTLDSFTDVGDGAPLATQYRLHQNYPNPFNPTTVLGCQLPVAGRVKLVVYDLLGREVKTLIDGSMEAGSHQVVFDAAGLASGVYYYRLTAGDFVSVRPMVLAR